MGINETLRKLAFTSRDDAQTYLIRYSAGGDHVLLYRVGGEVCNRAVEEQEVRAIDTLQIAGETWVCSGIWEEGRYLDYVAWETHGVPSGLSST